MQARPVELLFDEYAAAFARGERPRASEFVDRAGDEGDELAAMIDRFLLSTPRQQPSAEDGFLVAVILDREPPLLALRVRRGLKRDAVVDALLGGLGLKSTLRARLAEAYHELETGQLNPRGVDDSVWRELGALLSANVRELAALRPPPVAASPAFRADPAMSVETDVVFRQNRDAAVDEVDRLFRAVS